MPRSGGEPYMPPPMLKAGRMKSMLSTSTTTRLVVRLDSFWPTRDLGAGVRRSARTCKLKGMAVSPGISHHTRLRDGAGNKLQTCAQLDAAGHDALKMVTASTRRSCWLLQANPADPGCGRTKAVRSLVTSSNLASNCYRANAPEANVRATVLTADRDAEVAADHHEIFLFFLLFLCFVSLYNVQHLCHC